MQGQTQSGYETNMLITTLEAFLSQDIERHYYFFFKKVLPLTSTDGALLSTLQSLVHYWDQRIKTFHHIV